jgi:hypothetical protein
MTQRQIDDALVDTLLEDYGRWRLTCIALDQAYACWGTAPPDEQQAAYDRFVTALDMEERAACCLEGSWHEATAHCDRLRASVRSRGASA